MEARRGVGLVEVRTVPPGADIIVDGTNTGPALPLTSGGASFTTSTLSPGYHQVEALYSGDANFAASASAMVAMWSRRSRGPAQAI